MYICPVSLRERHVLRQPYASRSTSPPPVFEALFPVEAHFGGNGGRELRMTGKSRNLDLATATSFYAPQWGFGCRNILLAAATAPQLPQCLLRCRNVLLSAATAPRLPQRLLVCRNGSPAAATSSRLPQRLPSCRNVLSSAATAPQLPQRLLVCRNGSPTAATSSCLPQRLLVCGNFPVGCGRFRERSAFGLVQAGRLSPAATCGDLPQPHAILPAGNCRNLDPHRPDRRNVRRLRLLHAVSEEDRA
jgi:hypothetical protein